MSLNEAHLIRGIIALLNSIPSLVSEYSTLGGISANASLWGILVLLLTAILKIV